MESAAVCDVLHRIKIVSEDEHREVKELLGRVIAMLSKLCIKLEGAPGGGVPRA